jgi:transcriptional regulator with XRE-family HTH domain
VADNIARGDRLLALRMEKGRELGKRLTQPDVAEIAGVTLRAYQNWEASGTHDDAGKLREFGMDWAHTAKLAKYYKVDPESLVRRPTDAPVTQATTEDVHGLRSQLGRIEATLGVITHALEHLARDRGDEALVADLKRDLAQIDEADAAERAASDSPATSRQKPRAQ